MTSFSIKMVIEIVKLHKEYSRTILKERKLIQEDDNRNVIRIDNVVEAIYFVIVRSIRVSSCREAHQI